jgi:hypothetical protein
VGLDFSINEWLKRNVRFETNRASEIFYPHVVMLNRMTSISDSNQGIIENAFEECVCQGSSLVNA